MSIRVVITGSSRGIGFALCQQYCQSGAEVIAVCRTTSPQLVALGVTIIDGIDMLAPHGLEQLCLALDDKPVDILINNAGILHKESLQQMNFDDIRQQFEVNALGPIKTTLALLSRLKANSKVMNVTSRMGSIADNGSGGYYGYRMSKAALNMASVSLAKDLESQGIAVGIVHPGFVQTDMVGGAGDISATEAARRIILRINDLSLKNTGTFWHSNGDELPW